MENIDLDKLNDDINNRMVSEYLEQRLISSLRINDVYIIKKMWSVNTRFGRAILVALLDRQVNSSFQMFLPKRAETVLTDDIIKKVNSLESKYTFTYLGQSPTGGKMSRSLFKFGYDE